VLSPNQNSKIYKASFDPESISLELLRRMLGLYQA